MKKRKKKKHPENYVGKRVIIRGAESMFNREAAVIDQQTILQVRLKDGFIERVDARFVAVVEDNSV